MDAMPSCTFNDNVKLLIFGDYQRYNYFRFDFFFGFLVTRMN